MARSTPFSTTPPPPAGFRLRISHSALPATSCFPRGDCTLKTLSDDGVRVWIDDLLVIDDWQIQGATWTSATVRSGAVGEVHRIRLEYFQGQPHAEGWDDVAAVFLVEDGGPLQGVLLVVCGYPALRADRVV
jgi:hypothetical protein